MRIHNFGNDYVNHYKLEHPEHDKNETQHKTEVDGEKADGAEKTSEEAEASEKSAETEQQAEKQTLGDVLPDTTGGVHAEEQSGRVRTGGRGKKTKAKSNG